MGTHTGATEVTGPGSVGRVGKGVLAHACSMSALESPAGKWAAELAAGGVGTSSEQSTRSLSEWPRTVILRKAALNADWILAWLLTKDCHSQAVRYVINSRQHPPSSNKSTRQ